MLLNVVFLALLIAFLIALLYKTKYSFWKSQALNGPIPLPLLGTSLDVIIHNLPIAFVKNVQKYGRVYGTYEGVKQQLVVADVKLLKQICIKDFHNFTNRRVIGNFHDIFSKMMTVTMDKEWKKLRKIISPTFSTGKIKRMKPIIEECVKNAVDYLEIVAAKNDQLNLKQFWSRFTLEVISRCCFACNINSHKDPENEFFKHTNSFFMKPGITQIILMTIFFSLSPQVLKALKIEIIPKKSMDFMSTVISDLLKKRRKENSKQNDFLQLLIEAEEESDYSLTENEIIANCLMFFLAGYETTSTLLQYTCYALAMNAEIQEKLFHEIKLNCIKDSIDYETANKLPYLDAVICEALRMYPPFVNIERTASTDVTFEDFGVSIPKGTLVTIPIYAIHHDSEYFLEPEVFKPDRFLDDNRDNFDPYAYLPFGLGPRNCVAMRFAVFEAKLALINTILSFKIEKSSKTPLKPQFLRGIQLLYTKDIFVNIIKR